VRRSITKPESLKSAIEEELKKGAAPTATSKEEPASTL
jgi:hypothetical protein